jgi:hypothetical protein
VDTELEVVDVEGEVMVVSLKMTTQSVEVERDAAGEHRVGRPTKNVRVGRAEFPLLGGLVKK